MPQAGYARTAHEHRAARATNNRFHLNKWLHRTRKTMFLLEKPMQWSGNN
jgi:hypothetical protein